ncbi:MAG: hypothetical protein RML94_09240 [Bacteroidia bacterium]|nr:hypothetical protein [Bacteroidia bacterium]
MRSACENKTQSFINDPALYPVVSVNISGGGLFLSVNVNKHIVPLMYSVALLNADVMNNPPVFCYQLVSWRVIELQGNYNPKTVTTLMKNLAYCDNWFNDSVNTIQYSQVVYSDKDFIDCSSGAYVVFTRWQNMANSFNFKNTFNFQYDIIPVSIQHGIVTNAFLWFEML